MSTLIFLNFFASYFVFYLKCLMFILSNRKQCIWSQIIDPLNFSVLNETFVKQFSDACLPPKVHYKTQLVRQCDRVSGSKRVKRNELPKRGQNIIRKMLKITFGRFCRFLRRCDLVFLGIIKIYKDPFEIRHLSDSFHERYFTVSF